MMKNYNTFILLLENNNRDKKLERQRQKIHKFLTFEPIIDYVFDKVVDKDNTKGIQYTIWFADKIKKDFMFLIDEELKKDKNLKTNLNDILTGKNKDDLDLNTKWKKLIKHYDDIINPIVDWLKSPIREEQIDLSKYSSLSDAYIATMNWHDKIKSTGVVVNEKGTILMSFVDGYYWIDLETTSCSDEANAMGHCGTTSYGDTLYSLRKNQSPHVTVAIGSDGTIYQMKGRNNKKPIEKYHPYILELLKYPNNSKDVKIINGFETITNFSTVEYLSKEDFHIFDLTGNEIKELIKTNKTLIDNEGIGVKYKLFKEDLITKEELIENYKDLKIIDNKIHFIVDKWLSFSVDIFKPNRVQQDGWQIEILEGTMLFNYDVLEFDYKYEWIKLNENVFEKLYKYLIDKKYEIEYNDKIFMISSENTSIKKDNLWIKTPIGGVLSFKELLKNKSSKISTDSGLIDFYVDWLDLSSAFNLAYTMAQELADETEAYNTVTDSIQYKIGNLIKNNNDIWWYENDKSYLHFDLDFDFISRINAELSDTKYTKIIDMINDIPNISDYNSNDFLIECDAPYYGWQGSIDKDTLSEELIERIYDL